MNTSSSFYADWEHHAVRELYWEYKNILRERSIRLVPAAIELFDSEVHWGQWNGETRTIQLSRKLLRNHPWFQVLGILRHEMAHQLVEESPKTQFDEYPHGEVFQWACRRLGVPASFSTTSANLQERDLDWRHNKPDDESEKMLEKVRKLLALASSTNEHEAVVAMNRVREIYAKYNLENHSEDPFVHLFISNGSQRVQAHERKINSILVGHFFVEIISGQTFDVASGRYFKSVEIIGKRENVLMAEYVYHFLMEQSQTLVEKQSRENKSMTRSVRRSFRLGILQGFEEKLAISEVRDDNSSSLISKALVSFHKDRQLDNYISNVYPRLRNIKLGRQYVDAGAYTAGKKAGVQLTLHKPVTTSRGSSSSICKQIG